MLNILTIDPGYRRTGLFLKSKDMVKSFIIDNTKLKTEKEIYINIIDRMKIILKQAEIDIIYIEDYSYGHKASRVLHGAEAKAIIKYSIFSTKDIPIIYMPIQTWKKYIGNKITSLKKKPRQYREAINNQYGWDFKTLDECDAYLIAVCATSIEKKILKTKTSKRIYENINKIRQEKNENE